MSVTYSFVCDDCKESCWAGQGNSSRDYLYSYKYIKEALYKYAKERHPDLKVLITAFVIFGVMMCGCLWILHEVTKP